MRVALPLMILTLSGACAAPVRTQPAAPVPAAVIDVTPPADALAGAVRPVLDVADAAPLASVEGEATYYAELFTGRTTASGVVFDNEEPYAAHREYPFGTVLRVTNLANARHVDVVVVDRGPHGSSERQQRTIIDVSRSVAETLDFVRAGRTRVRVDVLVWGS